MVFEEHGQVKIVNVVRLHDHICGAENCNEGVLYCLCSDESFYFCSDHRDDYCSFCGDRLIEEDEEMLCPTCDSCSTCGEWYFWSEEDRALRCRC